MTGEVEGRLVGWLLLATELVRKRNAKQHLVLLLILRSPNDTCNHPLLLLLRYRRKSVISLFRRTSRRRLHTPYRRYIAIATLHPRFAVPEEKSIPITATITHPHAPGNNNLEEFIPNTARDEVNIAAHHHNTHAPRPPPPQTHRNRRSPRRRYLQHTPRSATTNGAAKRGRQRPD